ncbi:MAG: class I SAM-dependent methyltransferase [Neisseria sp.]|nr:class I SAM-dependent methyltransferase [Neisseria sp.]
MMPIFHPAPDTPPEILALAASYGFTPRPAPPPDGLYLTADGGGISLCRRGEKGRVMADFAGGAAQYRRLKGGGELIAKAVNYGSRPLVADATGGLGRDAFVLAAHGLEVLLIERHPAVACLLADGLRRALNDPSAAQAAARIRLCRGDAVRILPELAALRRPEVVYLDPMYPERRKSAAVKKEMAYFHELVGDALPDDDAALLAAARAAALRRVVVKRPRSGGFLAQCAPAYQYCGKTTRFDVYHPVTA